MDALPPPTGTRFAHLTPDDHSAPLWVVTLLCSIYAVLVLAVRLGYVKWRAHGLDDVVLSLAHVMGLAMWGLLFASLQNGLGKLFDVVDDADISRVQWTFFASRIILYIALALSKCSILILVQAVFKRNTKVSILANGTMGVIAVWGVVGILANSIGCSPNTVLPKPGSGYCAPSMPWLKAVAAGDIFTELVIVLLPLIGFYDTFMPIKRRFTVILAFSTRIPNIAFTIMYLLAYSRFVNHHRPAIRIVSTVAWQNVVLSYNLMSATIPSLKGFTQGFMTAGVSLGYAREGVATGASGTQQSYELRSLSKLRSKVSPQEFLKSQASATSVQGNAKPKSTRINVVAKDGSRCYHEESASIASHDSQQIMIKREWKVSNE